MDVPLRIQTLEEIQTTFKLHKKKSAQLDLHTAVGEIKQYS